MAITIKKVPKAATKAAKAEKTDLVRVSRTDLARDDFILMALMGQEITLKELAEKHGLSHQSVRNAASLGKWQDLAEARRKDIEENLAAKLTERTEVALDKLNKSFSEQEMEIRHRHALIAKGLQARAVTRLRNIPLEQFTARDALLMLRLGLEEERRAFGLPEFYISPPDTPSLPKDYRSVAEQIGGHKKVQQVGMALLKALRENVGAMKATGLVIDNEPSGEDGE